MYLKTAWRRPNHKSDGSSNNAVNNATPAADILPEIHAKVTKPAISKSWLTAMDKTVARVGDIPWASQRRTNQRCAIKRATTLG